MTTLTRRRFVQSTSAAAAALAAPAISWAQSPVALRFSSSMTADDNAAHYVWYQRLQANLKASVGDAIRLDYFPNNSWARKATWFSR